MGKNDIPKNDDILIKNDTEKSDEFEMSLFKLDSSDNVQKTPAVKVPQTGFIEPEDDIISDDVGMSSLNLAPMENEALYTIPKLSDSQNVGPAPEPNRSKAVKEVPVKTIQLFFTLFAVVVFLLITVLLLFIFNLKSNENTDDFGSHGFVFSSHTTSDDYDSSSSSKTTRSSDESESSGKKKKNSSADSNANDNTSETPTASESTPADKPQESIPESSVASSESEAPESSSESSGPELPTSEGW